MNKYEIKGRDFNRTIYAKDIDEAINKLNEEKIKDAGKIMTGQCPNTHNLPFEQIESLAKKYGVEVSRIGKYNVKTFYVSTNKGNRPNLLKFIKEVCPDMIRYINSDRYKTAFN